MVSFRIFEKYKMRIIMPKFVLNCFCIRIFRILEKIHEVIRHGKTSRPCFQYIQKYHRVFMNKDSNMFYVYVSDSHV